MVREQCHGEVVQTDYNGEDFMHTTQISVILPSELVMLRDVNTRPALPNLCLNLWEYMEVVIRLASAGVKNSKPSSSGSIRMVSPGFFKLSNPYLGSLPGRRFVCVVEFMF